MCLNIKCLVSISTNMSNYHPLQVVGRGSQTQLQVGENLNFIIQRLKGYTFQPLRHIYLCPCIMKYIFIISAKANDTNCLILLFAFALWTKQQWWSRKLIIATIVVFNSLYYSIKWYCEWLAFKHQKFGVKFNKNNHFHPLEVVGQTGGNLNYLI